MDFSLIGNYLTQHFGWLVSIVPILYIVEKLLEVIGTTFKIQIVDNIGVYLGNVLRALWPNQKPPEPKV